MRFRIGSTTYAVRVTEGSLTFEGTPCISACLQGTREILIAATCEPAKRGFALAAELTRAWAFETGTPRDTDGWLALAASMLNQAIPDLNAQGGFLALQSLRAGESPGHGAAKIGLTRARECAVCRGTVAGGSIACAPTDKPGVVSLELYCEFCDATQTWQEMQTAAGLPSGVVVGEPTFRRGDSRLCTA